MSSPRECRKARRRAERTMDEAFEALLSERLALAEKLARRAVAGSEMNPRLWLDLGRVLRRCGRSDDAEEALRRAIALARDYGEAFAELASFQAERGRWPQAVRLQRRAVELRPEDEAAAATLAHYAERAPVDDEAADPSDDAEPVAAPAETTRTARFDWATAARELHARGAARLAGLVNAEEREQLAALWHGDDFEHAVQVDDADRGRFEQRTFGRPLPPLVQELRAELYERLAPIADEWQRLLERRGRFPATLAGFLGEGAAVGQARSSPCLVRHAAGGRREPVREQVFRRGFPFRLELPLGPDARHTLRLLDVRGRRKRREHTFSAAPGDGLVFATPERLITFAGVVAAQPVLAGDAASATGQLVLLVPFHEIG